MEKREIKAIKEKGFITAKEYLDTSIILYPDSAELYYHRGKNNLYTDCFIKAKNNFDIYASIKPNELKVYGFVHHALRDTAKKISYYVNYLEHNPFDVEFLFNLVIFNWVKNKKKTCEEYLKKIFILKLNDNYFARAFRMFLKVNNDFA